MGAVVASDLVAQQRDAFVERILESCGGAFDIFTIYIGDRLGFYRELSNESSLTSSELAQRTGTHERYVREWLEQQTVTGVLEAHKDVSGTWRFRLPEGHSEVLADTESANHLAPIARILVGATKPLDEVLNAFRNGGGVAFEAYGNDLREGQGDVNRITYLEELGSVWIPAMPDVHTRLQSDPPARIADIGCGFGWSSIGMARHYPRVYVDGFDLDKPSIDSARMIINDSDVRDRVEFHCCDAGDSAISGHYDLVTACECVHDMSDPVSVLKTMRRLAGDDGTVLVVDERVEDEFSPQGGDVEWMMYGWSVLHCLPVGMADHPSVGTGTVMRPSTLLEYAKQAGFRDMEILPVDNFFFRLYRLHQ